MTGHAHNDAWVRTDRWALYDNHLFPVCLGQYVYADHDKNERLVQRPVTELRRLRGTARRVLPQLMRPGSIPLATEGIAGAALEIGYGRPTRPSAQPDRPPHIAERAP